MNKVNLALNLSEYQAFPQRASDYTLFLIPYYVGLKDRHLYQ
jgi:hypothetical protein